MARYYRLVGLWPCPGGCRGAESFRRNGGNGSRAHRGCSNSCHRWPGWFSVLRAGYRCLGLRCCHRLKRFGFDVHANLPQLRLIGGGGSGLQIGFERDRTPAKNGCDLVWGKAKLFSQGLTHNVFVKSRQTLTTKSDSEYAYIHSFFFRTIMATAGFADCS